MNIINSLEWRYATKKFNPSKKLSNQQVETLKKAFNLTATSFGLQPLKMIVISNKELQEKVFELLGFSEAEIEEQFGFMVNSFKYGAPPHGGLAFGVDRWVMLMAGAETIRDVIAFPKNNSGRDVMMDAPGPIDGDQMKELSLAHLPEEK